MVAALPTARQRTVVHYVYSNSECPERMDRIKGVHLFVRIVELGSFSKAAGDLGMTQPTATKLVAQMERQLGSRLLHRTTRGVTPTEIGALYYEKCRLIALHVDEAQNVGALLQSQVRGTLRISTSVAFGRRALVPRVLQFMRQHPKLSIDLGFEDRYVDLVEQGVDVAIRLGRLVESTYGARLIGTNPWTIVAAPSYLRARGEPAVPGDLPNHDALIYSSVQGDARWQLTGPDGDAHAVTLTGPLRSNNLSALLAAAREGFGLAALPLYVANGAIASGALVPVLTQWSLPSQEIHAVYPSPRMVPAKVRQLVDWLQGRFGPGWWGESS
jgi:DNA-binding transcriptional LysR family regulator